MMEKTGKRALSLEEESPSALREVMLDHEVRRSFLFEQDEEEAPLKIQFAGTVIDPETMFTEHEPQCLSKARGMNFAGGEVRREYKLSSKLYLEFLGYHILYFWVLGPLLPLILLPLNVSKYKNLLINMGFLFQGNLFIFQTTQWLSILALYYCLWSGKLTESSRGAEFTSLTFFYTLMVQSFLRMSCIATKYSSFSAYQIIVLKSSVVPRSELFKEYMMGYWRTQEHSLMLECIQEALEVGQVKTPVFFVHFLRMPRPKTVIALSYMVDNLRMEQLESVEESKYRKPRTVKMGDQEDSQMRTYFAGECVFHYIISKNKTVKLNRLYFVIVITFVRVVAVFILEWWMFKDPVWGYGKTNYDFLLGVFIQANITYFLVSNIGFFSVAITDILRKINVLAQINLMADMDSERSEKCILPLINFFDETSLYSWRALYTVAKEYGKKFFIRHKIFMRLVLAFLLLDFLALFYLVNHFPSDPYAKRLLVSLALSIDLDMGVYLFMVVYLILVAARFNSKLKQPTAILQKLIELLRIIKQFKSIFIHDCQDPHEPLSFTLYEQQIKDPVFRAFLLDLKKNLPLADVDSELDRLIQCYTILRDSIEFERENNSLSVLGVRLSSQLMFRSLALIIPAVLAIQQPLIEAIFDCHAKS